MAYSAHPRTDTVALIAVLSLSSLTMIWLFWHHPLKTAIVTVVLLCAFMMSARLARWMDTDNSSELGEGEHSPF